MRLGFVGKNSFGASEGRRVSEKGGVDQGSFPRDKGTACSGWRFAEGSKIAS